MNHDLNTGSSNIPSTPDANTIVPSTDQASKTEPCFSIHVDSDISDNTIGKIVAWLDPSGDIHVCTRGVDSTEWVPSGSSDSSIFKILRELVGKEDFDNVVGRHKHIIGEGLPLGGAFFYRRGMEVFVDGLSGDFACIHTVPTSFAIQQLGLQPKMGLFPSKNQITDEIAERKAEAESRRR